MTVKGHTSLAYSAQYNHRSMQHDNKIVLRTQYFLWSIIGKKNNCRWNNLSWKINSINMFASTSFNFFIEKIFVPYLWIKRIEDYTSKIKAKYYEFFKSDTKIQFRAKFQWKERSFPEQYFIISASFISSQHLSAVCPHKLFSIS